MSRWEAAGYSEIDAVEIVGDDFLVTFDNGDEVVVAAESVGISDRPVAVAVTTPERGAIVVTNESGQTGEVSWITLRASSDPAFAKLLRERDAEEARRTGRRLKALREDKGLPQNAVAAQAGMTAAQLAKIESGTSDVRFSTVRTLLRVLEGSLSDIGGPKALENSVVSMSKEAAKAGAPKELVTRLVAGVPREHANEALAKAFGWAADDLRSGEELREPPPLAVRFKAAKHQARSITPLVRFAYSACEVAVRMTTIPLGAVPADPLALHQELRALHGDHSLTSLVAWTWDRGIPIVPIGVPGEFHAAVWEINDRPTIALKQPHDLAAWWEFDLAHELGHIARGDVEGTAAILEQETRTDTESESAAHDYAVRAVLGDVDELVRRAVTLARGKVQFLKQACKTVAEQVGVSQGALAAHLAHEITVDGRRGAWWGAAQNLAKEEGPGRAIIEHEFRQRIPWGELDAIDAVVLQAALTDAD